MKASIGIVIICLYFTTCQTNHFASGKVYDRNDYSPLDSAIVTIYVGSRAAYQDTTDQNGYFELNVPGDEAGCEKKKETNISVEKIGYTVYRGTGSSHMSIYLTRQ